MIDFRNNDSIIFCVQHILALAHPCTHAAHAHMQVYSASKFHLINYNFVREILTENDIN